MAESIPRRRVLYVENGIGYGGAVICLRHLVRNLDRNRYESIVVTGRNGPEYRTISNDATWFYIRDHYIDTIGMRERLSLSRSLYPRWFSAVVSQLNARLDDIANFLPFFIGLLWRTWRLQPTLIHANNEPLCNRASLLVGRILRIPTICHVRGTLTGSWLMKWSYKLVDHYIPVSNWIAKEIANLGVPESKRTVIYDGIALDKLDPSTDPSVFRRMFNVPADAFAVGLVGLLIPWKGQSIFLDSVSLLRDKIPNLRMLIIGGTPEECIGFEKSLRRRVREEGMSDVVSFTGHVSNMVSTYAGLDVAVSASTSPEPLGTMVIETMAMGRALIAPNHGGAAEMTSHEATALLFEPGNATSLAKMILRLYRDPALRVRLGNAARDKARRVFDVGSHVDKITVVYEDLLRSANK